MRFAIFGLTVTSSWGNGHATLWRGLIRALVRAGHEVHFFERDVPYYAANRDIEGLAGAELVLYRRWSDVAPKARQAVAMSDAAIVTSYCPDAHAASALLRDEAPGHRIFYDLDTPVTLARLSAGEHVGYIPPSGLGDFDLVLSYTGGAALDALQERLGARTVAPLYGHVDPEAHRPGRCRTEFTGDLSYIGTYAADRQARLEELFLAPARSRPDQRFVLAGAGYPPDFPWTSNVYFVKHLPPGDHPDFFASSRLTLNVTRADMAAMGHCPSGRLFEAAACGTPLVSDRWEGLEEFFEPGREILVADQSRDVIAALDLAVADLGDLARRARERVLDEHTSERRARELVALIESAGPLAPHLARRDAQAGAPTHRRGC